MSRYKLKKSIKRASVGTYSSREFPGALIQAFMGLVNERRRGHGKEKQTSMQALRIQGVQELILSEGKDIFSSSFDVKQFNEDFFFDCDGLELRVANPFAITGNYVHTFACQDVVVRVSQDELDIGIRWVTLELSTLKPRDSSTEELCKTLSQQSPDPSLPWECDHEDVCLDRLIRSWVSGHASSSSKKYVSNEFDTNNFLGALWNRLSDCLNLHFSESLEQCLEESDDCSAIDGEESLEIALDQ